MAKTMNVNDSSLENAAIWNVSSWRSWASGDEEGRISTGRSENLEGIALAKTCLGTDNTLVSEGRQGGGVAGRQVRARSTEQRPGKGAGCTGGCVTEAEAPATS